MTSISDNDQQRVKKLSGDVFIAIASWAEDTNNLQPWQRKICYYIGKSKLRGSQLYAKGKRAQYAMSTYDEAVSLGFKH